MINFLIIFNGMFGIDNNGEDNFFDLCLAGCGGEKKEDKKPDGDLPGAGGCTKTYCMGGVYKDGNSKLVCRNGGVATKP
jgi:hypothetical protein